MTAEATATHCPYCSLQCGITLATAADGSIELTGRNDPINEGGLCIKGANAAELIRHPQRLTTPLVRDSRRERLRPASWDEALDRVAAAIRAAQARHGRDAVGCFGGGGLTNEKAYQLGKFARVGLRTSNIDYNGRFCMSAAAAAAIRAFGVDRGMPFPFADIVDADVVLLVGSNPADTMPPAMRFFAAGRARGARHIVVDPRCTATALLAQRHLQPVPHTDLSLANGMLHVAIRDGLVDEEYVAARTTGFDAVRRAVRSDWPDRVERTTGIPVAELTEVVHELAAARTAMILTARGAEQHADGTDTATAWINPPARWPAGRLHRRSPGDAVELRGDGGGHRRGRPGLGDRLAGPVHHLFPAAVRADRAGQRLHYKMIPAIFRGQALVAVAEGAEEGPALMRARRLSGAVIGIAGAVGALGGLFINLAFRQSFLSTQSGDPAYWSFLIFYVLCAVVTYTVYLRPVPAAATAGGHRRLAYAGV